jgi:probable rRNA maturation factor
MNIEYFNETKDKIEDLEQIKKIINKAIEVEKLGNLEFNIIFVDNEYIHNLNKEYRHIDRPTDVITFALEDTKDIVFEDIRVLGDIYISMDKAKEQAITYGHSLTRELCFLALHGFLHLLGYDHLTKEDELVMFSKQDEVLNLLKVGRD